MQAGYRLRAAEERDLPDLPQIERRAAALFEAKGFPPEALQMTCSREEVDGGLASGCLWVAVDGDDRAVGFALAVRHAGATHLEELDVDPAHGGRGIGTALLDWVCETARRRGDEHVTLTTYADVAWNAPWYERKGFRVLARGELGPELRRIVDDEATTIFSPERRVAMQRRVSRAPILWRWIAAAWLLGMVMLSQLASRHPQMVLPWTRMIPGRDKMGHFLLMGGLAFFAVMALAGRRAGGRLLSTPVVLLGVALIVSVEEGLQYWLPSRTFSLNDLASSLAGVALFGGAAALWRTLRAR